MAWGGAVATELTLAMSQCEQFEVMMYYCNCQAFHFLISQWGRSEVEATGLNDLFSGSRELIRFCKATQVDWTMSYLMYKDFPPQKRFAILSPIQEWPVAAQLSRALLG